MCTKRIIVTIEELKEHEVLTESTEIKGIIMMSKVKGTGPEFIDAFRCYFTLEDIEGKELMRCKYNPKKDLSICKEDGTPTTIILNHQFS